MAIGYNARAVTNGLVLCLDAANPRSYASTGTTWTDLSGNGYTGTLVDGPTYGADNGGSLVFDGINDRVHLVSPSNRWQWTPSGSGMNNMTVEFFVKSNDTGGNYISKPWNGSGEYNWRILPGSINLQIGVQSIGLSYTNLASTSWQHICAVINPTQAALYRNGSIYLNFTNHGITNNTPSGGDFSVELCVMSLFPYSPGWGGEAGFSINGNLSLLRIYNRVLTDNEIQQNFYALRGRYGI